MCKHDARSMGHAERFFGPGELPPEFPLGFCIYTRGQAFVGGLPTTTMHGIEVERGERPENYVRKAVSVFLGAHSGVRCCCGAGALAAVGPAQRQHSSAGMPERIVVVMQAAVAASRPQFMLGGTG